MKTYDLTQVKHIGAARMKVLNDSGITSLRKLAEIPLEKLARIETIGEHYAKLIKEAVTEVYESSPEKMPAKIESTQTQTTAKTDPDLQKRIKLLNKRLKQTNEKLKPLGKKKHLALYIDLKKRSKKLKRHLVKLDNLESNLPKKVRKKFIKKADALTAAMKNVGKEPKKKIYTALSQEIQSLSKMLRDTSISK
jgi:hypothetical protein